MADTDALAKAFLKTLTGSDDLGAYPDPLDVRLDTAVEAGWAVANSLNLDVPITAGTAPGPFAGDASVAAALTDQVLARYAGAAPTSKPRSLVERAQQLVALTTAITPHLTPPYPTSGGNGGGVVPPGEVQGSVIWSPAKDFATASGAIDAGYSRTQYESSDMNIHEGTDHEIPIIDTQWGRALKFTIPNHYIRLEAMPPQHLLDNHSSGVLYLGSWFALDPSFPRDPSAGWSVITQLHGNDTTSPRFSLQINHHEIRIGDGQTVCPVSPSTRYDWVMRCHLDKGEVTVWVNGTKRLDSFHCGTSQTPYYLKHGFYHSSSDVGGTVYQGPLKAGTGYGAVGPA